MHRFVYGLLLGMCLTPVVGLVAIFLGWTPVHATADPPRWERFLGREAFQSSMARQPKLQNPVQPNSGNLRMGMKIYRDNCAGCHGDSGKPSHWGTTGFYPRVPQFDIEPPLVPDWQMFWIVKRGVRYTGMAAWEGEMSDDNIWMVVTFLSHLRNLPPDVQGEWRGQQPSK